jgi:hypothetical protein
LWVLVLWQRAGGIDGNDERKKTNILQLHRIHHLGGMEGMQDMILRARIVFQFTAWSKVDLAVPFFLDLAIL